MLVSGKKYKSLKEENEKLKRELRQAYDENKLHIDRIIDLEDKDKKNNEEYKLVLADMCRLEDKVTKLENENKDLKSKRSSTEIMKNQILNICLYRDKKGRMVKTRDGEILVNEKISGVKIWDLVNLM
ncbi:hypothetical protein [Romboutsia hominis]|uniref:hypothetical protein n=1 Tax=Romboutsia hominis TaxID=1507512 RepID=UPI000B858EFE|nr:hypothetical protein [Romboutsia hominis]